MIPIDFMDRTSNLIDEWRWKGEPKMRGESWYITEECMHAELGTEARLDFNLTYIGPYPKNASSKLQHIIRQMNYNGSGVQMYNVPYNMLREHYMNVDVRERIEKVIFNDPATIIIWKDGKKTVVKAGEGEKYDPEKGLAMAISKYALGNEGNYYETFKKWLPEKVNIDGAYFYVKHDAKEIFEDLFAKYMNPPEEEKTDELD